MVVGGESTDGRTSLPPPSSGGRASAPPGDRISVHTDGLAVQLGGPGADGAPGADPEQHEGPVRVLVVDDHVLYRRGLEMVLSSEDDVEIVGEASDGVDAIGKAEKIEATDEDVQDQIKRLAARARTSEQAISGRLDEDQKSRLTAQARDRRIIDMIRAAARVNFE